MGTLNTVFDTAGNFTFDSNKIDLSSGSAKLKDRRDSAAIFCATFKHLLNGDYGAGALTATPAGSPSISNSRLVLDGASYVDFPGFLNTFTQTGTIRFKMKMGYAGAPGAEQTWFSMCIPGDNTNLLDIYHDVAGRIYFRLGSASGTYLGNSAGALWLPVLNQTYEIELNIDLTAGAQRLFIDGVQMGATLALTGVRSQTATIIRLGANLNGIERSLVNFSDFEIFNTVKHTANFSNEIPRESPTQYSIDDPTIVPNGATAMDALLGFSATIACPANTDVKFQMEVEGTRKWFNGTTWIDSDGTYNQANTASEIEANKDLLDISDGVRSRCFAVLHSVYGDATPNLSSELMDFDFFAVEPTPISQTRCYLRVKDIGLSPLAQVQLTATVEKAYSQSEQLVLPKTISAQTNAHGYLEISLAETESASQKVKFSLEYQNGASKEKVDFGAITIPNTPNFNLAPALAP